MSTDGREELRRRVRVDEAPPADAAVVIRGGPDTLSLLSARSDRSIESEHSDDRFIDCPHLLGGEPPDATTETLSVDRAELFNEYSR
jgi:hypothetical protein